MKKTETQENRMRKSPLIRPFPVAEYKKWHLS